MDSCSRALRGVWWVLRWVPVVVVVFLIVWPYSVVMQEHLRATARLGSVRVVLSVAVGTLAIGLLLFSYIQTIFTNPGEVPRSWYHQAPRYLDRGVLLAAVPASSRSLPLPDDEMETPTHPAVVQDPLLIRYREEKAGSALVEKYWTPRVRMLMGIVTETTSGRNRSFPRYCVHCECYKPDRTHHCRVCRRCVLQMDHHCPWINNCVGERNHKYFLHFIGYVPLVAVILLALCWVNSLLSFSFNEQTSKGTLADAGALLHFICALVWILVAGIILCLFFALNLGMVLQDKSPISRASNTTHVATAPQGHDSTTEHNCVVAIPNPADLGVGSTFSSDGACQPHAAAHLKPPSVPCECAIDTERCPAINPLGTTEPPAKLQLFPSLRIKGAGRWRHENDGDGDDSQPQHDKSVPSTGLVARCHQRWTRAVSESLLNLEALCGMPGFLWWRWWVPTAPLHRPLRPLSSQGSSSSQLSSSRHSALLF